MDLCLELVKIIPAFQAASTNRRHTFSSYVALLSSTPLSLSLSLSLSLLLTLNDEMEQVPPL